MKRLLIFTVILSFTIAARSAELLDGYIVTADHDTVQCKIKGGRFLLTPFSGAVMINAQGEEQSFGAKDKKVIAFGFTERYARYHYLYVDAGNKTESGYYQLLVNGPRYKLYSRPTTVYGGNPTYVLFNPAGQFTLFEPCLVCPWRKQLREFLKDDAKALALVETAPRVNIPKFATEINKEE